MKELNFELLKQMFCIHSKSMQEEPMRIFIKEWISANVESASVFEDIHGNLYVIKGISENYPCLCAHMDQVQDFHPDDFMCIDDGGIIAGLSYDARRQCGLGADDKNGLFIALSCLQKYDVLKCAFFVGEEVGCVGSSNADMEFFKNCRFCVQIDRKGNSDMVTSISGAICSDEFIEATDCEKWGYQVSDGLMTDVESLVENGVGISCINLSCGYYGPHTDYEFVSKRDIEKCYRFVCHIIEDCTDVYPFVSHYESFGYNGKQRPRVLDECDFIYLVDDYLREDYDVSFDDIYALHKDDYPRIKKPELYKLFIEEKEYYNFGN